MWIVLRYEKFSSLAVNFSSSPNFTLVSVLLACWWLLVAAGVTAPDGCGRVCLMPSWARGGPHGKATFGE